MRTAAARLLVATCSSALVAFVSTGASAAEAPVAIEAPAATTCVNQVELRDALVRAGVALATGADDSADIIRDPYPTRAPDTTLVTLRGTPHALAVTIRRHGVAETQSLPPATCETATDAVAAFLVSTLGPDMTRPPPRDAPPPPAAPSSALGPRATDPVEPARLKALRDAFERVPRREPAWLLPGLEVLLGSIALAAPSLDADAELGGSNTFSVADSLLLYATGTLWVGGGVAGYLAGPDRGTDLMEATWLAGMGCFFTTRVVPDSNFGRAARLSGFFTGAALAASNAIRGRPLERVHAARAEVAAGHLTRRRAGEIEADLREVDPKIPNWVVFSAPAVGFTVAAVGDFANRHEPSLYGGLNLLFAGSYLTQVAIAAGGTVWGSYERALERAGLKTLSLGPGPGAAGVSLTGTF